MAQVFLVSTTDPNSDAAERVVGVVYTPADADALIDSDMAEPCFKPLGSPEWEARRQTDTVRPYTVEGTAPQPALAGAEICWFRQLSWRDVPLNGARAYYRNCRVQGDPQRGLIVHDMDNAARRHSFVPGDNVFSYRPDQHPLLLCQLPLEHLGYVYDGPHAGTLVYLDETIPHTTRRVPCTTRRSPSWQRRMSRPCQRTPSKP